MLGRLTENVRVVQDLRLIGFEGDKIMPYQNIRDFRFVFFNSPGYFGHHLILLRGSQHSSFFCSVSLCSSVTLITDSCLSSTVLCRKEGYAIFKSCFIDLSELFFQLEREREKFSFSFLTHFHIASWGSQVNVSFLCCRKLLSVFGSEYQ